MENMEPESKEITKKVSFGTYVTTLLILLVIISGLVLCLWRYRKAAIQNFSYSTLAGNYAYTKQTTSEDNVTYYLKLFEDGTYIYEYSYIDAEGEFGNYYISDGYIVLNKWFDHGSDIGIYANSGKTKLKINNTQELIDTNSTIKNRFNELLNNADLANITLSRTTDDNIEYNDVVTKLKNSILGNGAENQ